MSVDEEYEVESKIRSLRTRLKGGLRLHHTLISIFQLKMGTKNEGDTVNMRSKFIFE